MIKLKAATLQETIVALTIIMICLSIGLMVFVNVMRSDKASERLKANMLLKQAFAESSLKQGFYDEVYSVGRFVIEKQIHPYDSQQPVNVLEIMVFKNEKLLVKGKQLIISYDDNE